MPFFLWSRTPANNGTADPTCSWPEGMAPSAVNDSARGNMARLREFADDSAGAIVTAGTASAYTIGSYEGFDSLVHLGGNVVAFTPHTGNASPVTLNVDGLGARPLRLAPALEVPPATLVQGTPYVALYNATDGAFYLRGFLNLPYSVPIGGLMPYIAAPLPNSNFVQPYGQALSRTTYVALFSLVGTTYGSGDGTSTFNIPDLRGRVPVGADAMGGAAAGRVTAAGAGFDGTAYGAAGGAQNKAITINEVAPHVHGVNDPGHAHSFSALQQASSLLVTGGTGAPISTYLSSTVGSVTGITIQSAGSGNAFSIMQPSIVMSYILRVF
jgi:microcystin-dependent protein